MMMQQLMRVSPEKRDLEWLMMSLQSAIELEHSTIPPYLCAYWSIMEDAKTPATQTIRKWIFQIVKQEMLHMGLACNLLTAIGGTPNIYCAGFVPKYPGPLPGHVRSGLVVGLAGLVKEDANDPVKKKEVVQTFMQIEYPEEGPIAREQATAREYTTIGEFYDAVCKAFEELRPPINLHRQMVSGGVGLKPIAILDDATDAIRLIKIQGEGTTQSPLGEKGGNVIDDDQLAHYYKFAAIYYEHKLKKDSSAPHGWSFTGDPLPFPPENELFLMAEVPPGGYDDSKDVDAIYTNMLKNLHYAWAEGDRDKLTAAITGMKTLQNAAVDLLKRKLPVPNGKGIKGPCFLFRP